MIVTQTPGPLDTQSTYIVQRPGWTPHFDKTMHRGSLQVGEGLHLSLCLLPVAIPREEHLAASLRRWRDEVQAAIAVVAALLDDRVAQEVLLEDLIVFDEAGREPVAMLDSSVRVRHFPSMKAATAQQRAALDRLAHWKSDVQAEEHVAARWYLRAAQSGPTPDAIIYLWVALEALVPARSKGSSSDVKGVEAALRSAGADPARWTPSVGRCAGLRAQIVHHGLEQPELLSEGFYSLEAMVRLLLRHRLGVDSDSWPLAVTETNLAWPFRPIAARLAHRARTTMRLIQDDEAAPGREK